MYEIRKFEIADYIKLNNGVGFLGRPLGFKFFCIITSFYLTVLFICLFLVPSKRNSLTCYENFGLPATLFFGIILFFILISLTILFYKEKSQDYKKGEKVVIDSKILQIIDDRKKSGYYIFYLDENDSYLNQVKFFQKHKNPPKDLSLTYILFIAPNSKIVLDYCEV